MFDLKPYGALLHSKWAPGFQDDLIDGSWAEDMSRFEVQIPIQLRALLLDLQNNLAKEYEKQSVETSKSSKDSFSIPYRGHDILVRISVGRFAITAYNAKRHTSIGDVSLAGNVGDIVKCVERLKGKIDETEDSRQKNQEHLIEAQKELQERGII